MAYSQTGATLNTLGNTSSYKTVLKHKELEVFNPSYKDPSEQGIVQGTKYTIFTDPQV